MLIRASPIGWTWKCSRTLAEQTVVFSLPLFVYFHWVNAWTKMTHAVTVNLWHWREMKFTSCRLSREEEPGEIFRRLMSFFAIKCWTNSSVCSILTSTARKSTQNNVNLIQSKGTHFLIIYLPILVVLILSNLFVNWQVKRWRSLRKSSS